MTDTANPAPSFVAVDRSVAASLAEDFHAAADGGSADAEHEAAFAMAQFLGGLERTAPSDPGSLLAQYDSIRADLARLRTRESGDGEEYENLGEPRDEEWENIHGRMEDLLNELAQHVSRTLWPFACAECGTTTEITWVVTQLDPEDPLTRTEVCQNCEEKLSRPEDASDPADEWWTVIGVFDGEGKEVPTAVLYGCIGIAVRSTDHGSWVAHVRAEDATEAAAVALADRAGE